MDYFCVRVESCLKILLRVKILLPGKVKVENWLKSTQAHKQHKEEFSVLLRTQLREENKKVQKLFCSPGRKFHYLRELKNFFPSTSLNKRCFWFYLNVLTQHLSTVFITSEFSKLSLNLNKLKFPSFHPF